VSPSTIPLAFTTVCSNCRRVVQVYWDGARGHYTYEPHPPKKTVCYRSGSKWEPTAEWGWTTVSHRKERK
jgi:hypothetical protein